MTFVWDSCKQLSGQKAKKSGKQPYMVHFSLRPLAVICQLSHPISWHRFGHSPLFVFFSTLVFLGTDSIPSNPLFGSKYFILHSTTIATDSTLPLLDPHPPNCNAYGQTDRSKVIALSFYTFQHDGKASLAKAAAPNRLCKARPRIGRFTASPGLILLFSPFVALAVHDKRKGIQKQQHELTNSN